MRISGIDLLIFVSMMELIAITQIVSCFNRLYQIVLGDGFLYVKCMGDFYSIEQNSWQRIKTSHKYF